MKTLIKESDLKNMIRSLVRESLEGFDFNDPNLTERDKKSSKKKPGKGKKKSDKILYKNHEKHIKNLKSKKDRNEKAKIRQQVLNYFRRKTKRGTLVVKSAPYAYALWPDLEKSNARSQFTKCLWNKLNDDDYPYSFTDAEISQLRGMISSATPTVNESLNEGYAYGGNLTGEELYLTVTNDSGYYNRYIMPLVRSVAKKPDISFEILVKSKVMANMSKVAVDLYQNNISDEPVSISTAERSEFKRKMAEYIIGKVEEMKKQSDQ